MSESPSQRYKLTVAYDGTLFHGWQRQDPPHGVPLRTVQGEMEQILSRTLGQPIVLSGASRTDAGVHALGQVAVFEAICRIPLDRLAEALNARLPADVEVVRAELAPEGLDIRHAVSKQYRYRMFTHERKPLDRRHYVYHCWQALDLGRMNDAARRLVGEHDFEGFSAAGHGRLTTVRTIHDCRVEPCPDQHETHIVVAGNGFLYNMVRIIAGTLVEVGRGRLEPTVIDEVLAHRDRSLAGQTLPPNGLWLEWIRYE